MRGNTIELSPERVDEMFDEMPEVGDELITFQGESVIIGIDIVNQSKMSLCVVPKRDVKRFDDPADRSVEWSELPSRFLREKESFEERGSLTV